MRTLTDTQAMSPRRLVGWIAAIMPLLSGVAFYAWLELGPKTWVDPECGVPATAFYPALVLCLGVPPTVSGVRGVAARKPWLAISVRVVGSILVTAAVLLVAFLAWFGKHQCGE